jgi:DNA-binding NarL/FixJ family response regulator
MIRTLVADDHMLVREGLKKIFATVPDITVVAEATNGQQVIDHVRSTALDLVLLDITMPGISGADLIRRLKALRESLPILVLSMHNEGQIATRVLKAGAAGYVTKDSDPLLLLGAIRKVASGGKYIDPVLAQQMAFDATFGGDRAPHELLSDREEEVFRLLVVGKSVSEIAGDLRLSVKTVSTHKMRLMRKLGVETMADLVRYAISHGLTS